MLRLGLTGGIGSGKSTVAALLADLGAGVIDADAISRSATASNGLAIATIAAEFGRDFIDADGALDRARMRDLVFRDTGAKLRLEAIVHPLVARQIQKQASDFEGDGKTCAVFDIPLLVESKRWRAQLDRVLVVDCSAATQVSRVAKRSGMRTEEVERVIASQADRIHRLCAADLVLHNDAITLDALVLQVKEIASQFGL